VNSLRIDDATEATRIIDGITAIYATLNQVKGRAEEPPAKFSPPRRAPRNSVRR
jgi:hypothetical protein